MSGGFADITGITARTCKLVNHTRTKPAGDRVLHTKKVADLKGRKNWFRSVDVLSTFPMEFLV
jgi:hypothetical protein